MGNILTYASNRGALASNDSKWLMMKANEFYDESMGEEYLKLPEFEGTERPKSRSVSTSKDGKATRKASLSTSLFDVQDISPALIASILSLRSNCEEYYLDKLGKGDAMLLAKYLNDLKLMGHSSEEVIELSTTNIGTDDYNKSVEMAKCVRARAVMRLHLAIARQMMLPSDGRSKDSKNGNASKSTKKNNNASSPTSMIAAMETAVDFPEENDGQPLFVEWSNEAASILDVMKPEERAAATQSNLLFGTSISMTVSTMESVLRDARQRHISVDQNREAVFKQLEEEINLCHTLFYSLFQVLSCSLYELPPFPHYSTLHEGWSLFGKNQKERSIKGKNGNVIANTTANDLMGGVPIGDTRLSTDIGRIVSMTGPNVDRSKLATCILEKLGESQSWELEYDFVIYEWARGISNTSLRYGENSLSVTRPGNTSSYPAALCKIPENAKYACMTVVLQKAKQSSNWLTIGLGQENFKLSSGNGFGKEKGSWGIVDDRSSSRESAFACDVSDLVSSENNVRDSFRKLQEGDIVSVIANMEDGWLEIIVNFVEKVKRFDISKYIAINRKFVMGCTMANDHTLKILPMDVRFLMQSALNPGNQLGLNSLAILRADEMDVFDVHCGDCSAVMESVVGIPHTYDTPHVSIICNGCNRNPIHHDQFCLKHCKSCHYDLCFACSILTVANNGKIQIKGGEESEYEYYFAPLFSAPGSGTVIDLLGEAATKAQRRASRALSLFNGVAKGGHELYGPLCRLNKNTAGSVAIDQLIELSRKEVHRARETKTMRASYAAYLKEMNAKKISANRSVGGTVAALSIYSQFANMFRDLTDRDGNEKEVPMQEEEEETETCAHAALSLMFAIAILRQSLSGVLEVIFLLADADLDLSLSEQALSFVEYFLRDKLVEDEDSDGKNDNNKEKENEKEGTEKSDKGIKIEIETPLSTTRGEKAEKKKKLLSAILNDSCDDADLLRDIFLSQGERENFEGNPLATLTKGQRQAVCIAHALGDIVAGSYLLFQNKKLLFPIHTDSECTMLLNVIEAEAMTFSQSDKKGPVVNKTADSMLRTLFATQCLQIVFFNVQQLFRCKNVTNISENALLDAYIDVPGDNWPKISFQKRINELLDMVVHNPSVDPAWSNLGKTAVQFASLSYLTPVASQQFASVCTLLERMESGLATMCEKEVLLSQMSNLEGPKLLELMRSTTSRKMTSSPSQKSIIEDNAMEGTHFLISLLNLANRSLLNRFSKAHEVVKESNTPSEEAPASISDGEGDGTSATPKRSTDVQEVLQEVVLNVLEPIAIQVLSTLIHDIMSLIPDNIPEATKLCDEKLLPLVRSFLISAQKGVDAIVSKEEEMHAAKSSFDSDESWKKDREKFVSFIYKEVESSHVSYLIPLVLFSIGTFWEMSINSGNLLFRDDSLAELYDALEGLQEGVRKSRDIYLDVQASIAGEESAPSTKSEAMFPSSSPSSSAIDLWKAVETPAVVKSWDLSLSNTNLEYSETNTTCRRPGNVSCYPAAFIPMPHHYTMCTFKLTQARGQSNWLSIGVTKSSMSTANGDGFGRERNSWGICDDRSDTHGCAMFYAHGQSVMDAPRKLRENDIITVLCNRQTKELTISVNNFEFSFTFKVSTDTGRTPNGEGTPEGPGEDGATYYFGATFANDHSLQVLDNMVLKRSTEDGSISFVDANGVIEPVAVASVPVQNWLERLYTEVRSLLVVALKHGLKSGSVWNSMPSKEMESKEGEAKSEDFKVDPVIVMWTSSPLLKQGMIALDASSFERDDDLLRVNRELGMLRELTDAPNGAGDSAHLVTAMKKLVMRDRGRDAGPNHITHAACAAMLWHSGLSRRAYEVMESAMQGTSTARPRLTDNTAEAKKINELILLWQNGQNLRNVFQVDEDELSHDDTDDFLPEMLSPPPPLGRVLSGGSNDMAIINPTLMTPPLTPKRSNSDGSHTPRAASSSAFGQEVGSPMTEKDLYNAIPVRKQYSLPLPEDGESPLNAVTLAAVRRARLLLKFHPAINVCSKSGPTLKTTTNKGNELKMKSIYNFILHGPLVEPLKEHVARMNLIAKRRRGSFLNTDRLLASSTSMEEKGHILRILMGYLVSMRKMDDVNKVASSSKEKSPTPATTGTTTTVNSDSDNKTTSDSDKGEAAAPNSATKTRKVVEDFIAPVCDFAVEDSDMVNTHLHYLSGIHGCDLVEQKSLRTGWFSLLRRIKSLCLTWLEELEIWYAEYEENKCGFPNLSSLRQMFTTTHIHDGGTTVAVADKGLRHCNAKIAALLSGISLFCLDYDVYLDCTALNELCPAELLEGVLCCRHPSVRSAGLVLQDKLAFVSLQCLMKTSYRLSDNLVADLLDRNAEDRDNAAQQLLRSIMFVSSGQMQMLSRGNLICDNSNGNKVSEGDDYQKRIYSSRDSNTNDKFGCKLIEGCLFNDDCDTATSIFIPEELKMGAEAHNASCTDPKKSSIGLTLSFWLYLKEEDMEENKLLYRGFGSQCSDLGLGHLCIYLTKQGLSLKIGNCSSNLLDAKFISTTIKGQRLTSNPTNYVRFNKWSYFSISIEFLRISLEQVPPSDSVEINRRAVRPYEVSKKKEGGKDNSSSKGATKASRKDEESVPEAEVEMEKPQDSNVKDASCTDKKEETGALSLVCPDNDNTSNTKKSYKEPKCLQICLYANDTMMLYRVNNFEILMEGYPSHLNKRSMVVTDFVNAWPFLREACRSVQMKGEDRQDVDKQDVRSQIWTPEPFVFGTEIYGESSLRAAMPPASDAASTASKKDSNRRMFIAELSLFPYALTIQETAQVCIATGNTLRYHVSSPTKILHEVPSVVNMDILDSIPTTTGKEVSPHIKKDDENEKISNTSVFASDYHASENISIEEIEAGSRFSNYGEIDSRSVYATLLLSELTHNLASRSEILRFQYEKSASGCSTDTVSINLFHSFKNGEERFYHSSVYLPNSDDSDGVYSLYLQTNPYHNQEDFHTRSEDQNTNDSVSICLIKRDIDLGFHPYELDKENTAGPSEEVGYDIIQQADTCLTLNMSLVKGPKEPSNGNRLVNDKVKARMEKPAAHFRFDVPAGGSLTLLRNHYCSNQGILADKLLKEKVLGSSPISVDQDKGKDNEKGNENEKEKEIVADGEKHKVVDAKKAATKSLAVTMWDIGLSLCDYPANFYILSPCHKTSVIRYLTHLIRLGKACVVVDNLNRCDCKEVNYFAQLFCDRAVIVHLFDLAFRASSSHMRLLAIRALCLVISMVPPKALDAVLLEANYISGKNTVQADSLFLTSLVYFYGALVNPYAALNESGKTRTTPCFSVPILNRALLLFQVRELMESFMTTTNKSWQDTIKSTFTSVTPQALLAAQFLKSVHVDISTTSVQSCLQQLEGPMSSHGETAAIRIHMNWLLGILACTSPDHLAGMALYPGAKVSHKGLGSSMYEEFSVISFEGENVEIMKEWGSMMYITPTCVFDKTTRSELSMDTDLLTDVVHASSYGLELVYASILQKMLVPMHNTATNMQLAKFIATNGEFVSLMHSTLCLDTVDSRPLPYFPQEKGSNNSSNTRTKTIKLEFESLHPYLDNTEVLQEISIPGAPQLVIRFDSRTRTEQNYDYVKFYKDRQKTGYWGQDKYSGSKWPGIGDVEALCIPADTVYMNFHSDGSNNDWGYKFTVEGVIITKIPRSLRFGSRPLLMQRLVKNMALSTCSRLLSLRGSGSEAGSTEGEEEPSQLDLSQIAPSPPRHKQKKEEFLRSFENTFLKTLAPTVWRSLLESLVTFHLSKTLTDMECINTEDESKADMMAISLSQVPASDDKDYGSLLRAILNSKSVSSSSLSSQKQQHSVEDTELLSSYQQLVSTNPPKFGSPRTPSTAAETKSIDSRNVVTSLETLANEQLFPSVESKGTSSSASASAQDMKQLAGTLYRLATKNVEQMYDASSEKGDSAGIFSYISTSEKSPSDTVADTVDLSNIYSQIHDMADADVDKNDSDGNANVQTPKLRLQCHSGTTHCRIRMGPSLDTAEVGDMISGGDIESTGVINGFHRLADGRGFMKMFIEGSITWSRVDERRPNNSDKYDPLKADSIGSKLDHGEFKSRCPPELKSQRQRDRASAVDYWDAVLLNTLDSSVHSKAYDLLCNILECWPTSLRFDATSEAELFFLLKVAGLGRIRSKGPSKRTPSKRTLYTRLTACDYESGDLMNTRLSKAFRTLFSTQIVASVSGMTTTPSLALSTANESSEMPLARAMLMVTDKVLRLSFLKDGPMGNFGPFDYQDFHLAQLTAATESKETAGQNEKEKEGKKESISTAPLNTSGKRGKGGTNSNNNSGKLSVSKKEKANNVVSVMGGGKMWETKHPYENDCNDLIRIHIPGAKGLEIVFDRRCSTEKDCDHISIYADSNKGKQLGGKYSGVCGDVDSNWPSMNNQPNLILEGREDVWIEWITDDSNTDWGVRMFVYPLTYAKESKHPHLELNPPDIIMNLIKDKNGVNKGRESDLKFRFQHMLLSFPVDSLNPSISFSLGCMELLLEAASYNEDFLHYLFYSSGQFSMIRSLEVLGRHISKVHPAVFKCYLSVISTTMLLYEKTLKLRENYLLTSEAEKGIDFDNSESKALQVLPSPLRRSRVPVDWKQDPAPSSTALTQQDMMLIETYNRCDYDMFSMWKHISSIFSPVMNNKKVGSLLRHPVPLMQSFLQTAVTSYHAAIHIRTSTRLAPLSLCSSRNQIEIEPASDKSDGDLKSSKKSPESEESLWPPMKGFTDEREQEQALYMNPVLTLTHQGHGLMRPPAKDGTTSGGHALALGPIYPEISFPWGSHSQQTPPPIVRAEVEEIQKAKTSSTTSSDGKKEGSDDSVIVVEGAGTVAANGMYRKTEEMMKGKPCFRKEGSKECWIQWWDESCGWELYHDGLKDKCSYWTKGSASHGSNPAEAKSWSVRGAEGPPPIVRAEVEKQKAKTSSTTSSALPEVEVSGLYYHTSYVEVLHAPQISRTNHGSQLDVSLVMMPQCHEDRSQLLHHIEESSLESLDASAFTIASLSSGGKGANYAISHSNGSRACPLTTIREGDVIGVTVTYDPNNKKAPDEEKDTKQENSDKAGSKNDTASSASGSRPNSTITTKDDSSYQENSIWYLEYTINGVSLGEITYTHQELSSHLRLATTNANSSASDDMSEVLDNFYPCLAVDVPEDCALVFRQAGAVPFAFRRNSSAVISPLDVVQASSTNTRNKYHGTVINKWNPKLSDTELVFSQNDTCCMRPGSSSCYPASLVEVEGSSASLTVSLAACPIGPNSMSIGLAHKDFRKSGSDGFGPSSNSWGLIESRSSGPGKVYQNKQVVGSFRKMSQGDIFTIRYEKSLGKAWLYCFSENNPMSGEPEMMQEFTIHDPYEEVALVMGATYCNDHMLKVEDLSPPHLPDVDQEVVTTKIREVAPQPVLTPSASQEGGKKKENAKDGTKEGSESGKFRNSGRRGRGRGRGRKMGGSNGPPTLQRVSSVSSVDSTSGGYTTLTSPPDFMELRYLRSLRTSRLTHDLKADDIEQMKRDREILREAHKHATLNILESSWCSGTEYQIKAYHANCNIMSLNRKLDADNAAKNASIVRSAAVAAKGKAESQKTGPSAKAVSISNETDINLHPEATNLSTVYSILKTLHLSHHPPELAQDLDFKAVPAPLIYNLLVPLCMVYSSEVVTAYNPRSVLSDGNTADNKNTFSASVKIPGAVCYAIKVSPRSRLLADSNFNITGARDTIIDGDSLKNIHKDPSHTFGLGENGDTGPQRVSETDYTHTFGGTGRRNNTSRLFYICNSSTKEKLEAKKLELRKDQEATQSDVSRDESRASTPADKFMSAGNTSPESVNSSVASTPVRVEHWSSAELGLHTGITPSRLDNLPLLITDGSPRETISGPPAAVASRDPPAGILPAMFLGLPVQLRGAAAPPSTDEEGVPNAKRLLSTKESNKTSADDKTSPGGALGAFAFKLPAVASQNTKLKLENFVLLEENLDNNNTGDEVDASGMGGKKKERDPAVSVLSLLQEFSAVQRVLSDAGPHALDTAYNSHSSIRLPEYKPLETHNSTVGGEKEVVEASKSDEKESAEVYAKEAAPATEKKAGGDVASADYSKDLKLTSNPDYLTPRFVAGDKVRKIKQDITVALFDFQKTSSGGGKGKGTSPPSGSGKGPSGGSRSAFRKSDRKHMGRRRNKRRGSTASDSSTTGTSSAATSSPAPGLPGAAFVVGGSENKDPPTIPFSTMTKTTPGGTPMVSDTDKSPSQSSIGSVSSPRGVFSLSLPGIMTPDKAGELGKKDSDNSTTSFGVADALHSGDSSGGHVVGDASEDNFVTGVVVQVDYLQFADEALETSSTRTTSGKRASAGASGAEQPVPTGGEKGGDKEANSKENDAATKGASPRVLDSIVAPSFVSQLLAERGVTRVVNEEAMNCDGQLVTVRWSISQGTSIKSAKTQTQKFSSPLSSSFTATLPSVPSFSTEKSSNDKEERGQEQGYYEQVIFIPDDNSRANSVSTGLVLTKQSYLKVDIPFTETPAESISPLINYAQKPMRRSSISNTFYCGLAVGVQQVSSPDGVCGPEAGPQCIDCRNACKKFDKTTMANWEAVYVKYDYWNRSIKPRTLWSPVMSGNLDIKVNCGSDHERDSNPISSISILEGDNEKDSNEVIYTRKAERLVATVIPVLSIDAVLYDEKYQHLRDKVIALASAMTSDEWNILKSTKTSPDMLNRLVRHIAKRMHNIDESIIRLMDEYEKKLTNKANTSNKTPQSLVNMTTKWSRISPVTMKELVQYPSVHAALIEERRNMNELLKMSRSGIRMVEATPNGAKRQLAIITPSSSQPNMSQDNDGRDITDLPPSASHVGDMTDFGEIKAGGWAILSSDEASNALKTKENEDVNDGGEGDEDEVNNDKNDTRDNSGDNGKEDNGKGEKDDVDNKESKKRVKTKIHRRQFDPRKSHLLSARYCMLHLLNAHLTRCINQMDLSRMLTIRLSSTLGTSINEAWNAIDRNALIRPDHSVIQSLGGLLRSNRSFILSSVTNPIVTQSIAKTEYQGSKFDLVLSRPRAAKFINLGECDTNGRWSCFGQAFRAMHGMPCSNLRRSSALWETVFAGERAQDAGGPYREAWSAFTQELMSPHNVLPLFRLSPNGVNNVGTYCESMVLNPTATTRTQMEMFAFLGKLFGVAARSKNYLDLSLNPLAWKLIAQETVTPDDIRDVDILTMRWLDKVQSPDIMPEELAEVNFTSVDFAGNVVEIHKNGADDYIAPGSGDVDRYVREVIDFKLYEMMPAANAIRAGLETQIPPSALSLLRASDLEIMVCGIPTVDVELLKSCTEYSGCAITDQHIVWFWEIMEKDFDQADLKAFIKFAWGRSRLPLTKNGFTQLMKLQRFHNSNPDNYLPVSHTCFFSVEVPRYSTKENMRSKFLYAIHNCMAIDGDENNIGTRNGDIASWD